MVVFSLFLNITIQDAYVETIADRLNFLFNRRLTLEMLALDECESLDTCNKDFSQMLRRCSCLEVNPLKLSVSQLLCRYPIHSLICNSFLCSFSG